MGHFSRRTYIKTGVLAPPITDHTLIEWAERVLSRRSV